MRKLIERLSLTRRFRGASIVPVSLIVALVACGQVSYTAEEHLARGLGLEQQGDIAAAGIEYRNALQQDPTSAEGRFRLGMLLLSVGDSAGAETELVRASERGWDMDELRIPLLQASLLQNRHARVVDETRILESFTQAQVPDALALRGAAFIGLGQYSEARQALTEALELRPESPEAHMAMAVAVARAGEGTEGARPWLQRAIASDDRNPRAWSLMGELEQAEGNLEAAEIAYGNAVERSPRSYMSHYRRATVRLAQEDLTGAEADLSAMRRLQPRLHTTAYVQGLLHLKHERFSEAQTSFHTSLQAAPDFAPATFFLGVSHFAMEQWEQAETQLRRFLTSFPQSVEAARLLAMVRMQHGDYARAQALLNPVLMQTPDDVIALSLMGATQLGQGQRDDGLANLKRAIELRPDATLARTSLANELLRSGDLEGGIRELEALVDLAPGVDSVDVTLVLSLIQAGEHDRALAAIDRLRSASPRSPLPDNLLAVAYLFTGDTGRGQQALVSALAQSPGDPFASDLLARLALQRGDADEARRILRDSLRRNSENLGIVMQMVRLEFSEGNLAAAAPLLEETINRHPQAIEPRLSLALHHLSRNEPQRALVVLQPALTERRSADWRVLELAAQAQLASGQNGQALNTLRILSDRVPASADAAHRVGLQFERAGSSDDARTQFKRAIELDPRHAAARTSLSVLEQSSPEELQIIGHLRAREFDQALEVVTQLQSERPDDPLTWNLTGATYLAMGEEMRAREAFLRSVGLAPDYIPAADNLARLLTRQGNLVGAREVLQGVLRSKPDHLETLMSAAGIEMARGDQQAALDLLEHAATSHPSALGPRLILSRLYLQAGEQARAIGVLEAVADEQRDDPVWLQEMGSVQMATGQPAEAVETFSRLTQVTPSVGDAYFRLAEAQVASGDISAAETSIDRAVELEPDLIPAQLAKARMLAREGKLQEANTRVAGLRQRHPGNADILIFAGDLALAMNRPGDAAMHYQEVMVRAPSSRVAVALARAQSQAGESDQGRNTLSSWLAVNPEDVPVRVALAEMYRGVEDLAEAKLHYRRVLEFAPRNVVALNNLAWLLREGGLQEALQLAQRAAEEAPELAAVLDTYGVLLTQAGEAQRGVTMLRDAVERAPDNPQIRLHLAEALVVSGATREALDVLEALLDREADFEDRDRAVGLRDELAGS